MNKGELIYEVSKFSEVPREEIADLVSDVFKKISQALRRGEVVQITGFGIFKLRERQAHNVLNPRTGEPITIPAHKRIVFVPYKALKEAVK